MRHIKIKIKSFQLDDLIRIIETSFPVETARQVQTALQAMDHHNIETATIYDGDGEATLDSLDVDLDPKLIALADVLKVSPLDCSPDNSPWLDDQFQCDTEPGEYRVLTSDERDRAWDEALESYIDECIIALAPKGTEVLTQYFDREAWKRDARHDSAGISLAPYDHVENKSKVGDVWYYVYRVN